MKDALAAAERHWSELDFELTIEAADKVLAQSQASRAERVEALRLKGSALIVLEREKEAVVAFEQLFAIDPEYELPDDTSPRILAVYRPARAAWQVKVEEKLATDLGESYGALGLTVRAPPHGRGGLPVVIDVEVTDPAGIANQVVLGYRRRGQRYFSTLSARAQAGTVELTIPGSFTASTKPYVLELFVRLQHKSGGTLRRQGQPDAPLTIQMSSGKVPVATPIYKRWWFWTAAGAVAATGGILLLNLRDVGPQRIEGVER